MPYSIDKIRIDDKFLDKRIKMLPCQKERLIIMYNSGYSIHSLSKIFHVSRRAIQFILFPERLEKNKYDRQLRGGTIIYYNKEEHCISMKKYRNRKHKIFKA